MFLGYALLWTGFLSALLGTGLYAAVGTGRTELRVLARGFFALMSACLAGSAAYLLYLILTHHFQVQYVYQYSSRDLPTYYLVSCFWGGQQGTFLLWAFYGGLLGLILMRTARDYEGWALTFLGSIQCFLLLLLVTKNPFTVMPQVPLDGQGLNPLLQDYWMVIHPPILFLGFTSMAIPFVFALGALMKNDPDGWIKPALPWVVLGSWVLGTGLVMGGYWAYKVLGWGGYWAWDPVENSSLVPWLTNTALLHGIALQRANGSLKRSNLILAICSFLLVVWGTFLTRSGVLGDFSVHSFLDLGITSYLVAFIVVFAVLGLGLFLWRFAGIRANASFETALSREFMLVSGIILLSMAAGVTLLGMSSPLISRLFGPPAAVQPSFYNMVDGAIAVLVGFGAAVAMLFGWRRNPPGTLKRFWLPLTLAAATTVGLALWKVHKPFWLGLTAAGSFAIFGNSIAYLSGQRREPLRVGAFLAHVGFGMVLIGAVVSNGYSHSEKFELTKGHAVRAFGFDMTYRGIQKMADGKHEAVIDVTRGSEKFSANPHIYFSAYNQGVMRTPAIKRYPSFDLYIAPIEELNPSEQSGSMELKQHQLETVGRYRVRFDGLRLADREAMAGGHGGTVYADLTLTDPELHETKVSPGVKIIPGQELHPAELPGGTGHVAIGGINVKEKKVQLAFDGVGLPATLEMIRGDSKRVGTLDVEFVGFRVPDPKAMQSGGAAEVFVDLLVTRDGKAVPVAPSVRVGTPRDEILPAKLPDGQGEVRLTDLKVESGTIKLDWSNVPGVPTAPPPALAVEITIKPLILLFWIGTVMVSLGFLLTLVRRAGEWGRMGGKAA